MSILSNNASGGTPGQLVTTGNSGGASGNAFSAVSAAGVAYATVNGATVVQVQNVTAQAVVLWNHPTLEQTAKQRLVFSLSAFDTDDLYLERTAYGTTIGVDSGLAYAVVVSSAGKLKIFSKAAGSTAALWVSDYTLGLADVEGEYRLEVFADAGTSATTGRLRVTLYADRTSTTPLDDTGLMTGLDLAGTAAAFVRTTWLKYDGGNYAGTLNAPLFKLATGADAVNVADPVGSSTANTPPTVTVAVSSVQVVQLNSTISDDSGVASRLWSITSWPAGAQKPVIDNPGNEDTSFPWTVPGTYAGTLVVTDNGNPALSTSRPWTVTTVGQTAGPGDSERLVWDGNAFV